MVMADDMMIQTLVTTRMTDQSFTRGHFPLGGRLSYSTLTCTQCLKGRANVNIPDL